MAAIVVHSPGPAPGDLTATPRDRAGRRYRFQMTHRAGGWRAYADTATELVATLIPGYAELRSEQGRREARIDYAAGARVGLQATLMAGRLSSCSDAELRVLLASRGDPPPAPRSWAATVPLVLVTSFYTPTGFLAPPAAQPPAEILWLDPEDEFTLLTSLHAAGMLEFTERSPTATDDESVAGPGATPYAEGTRP